MFCIKCGTKLPDESKFCVSCGKKIKSISEPKPRGKVCPYCKKTIPQNSASCPECNRALVENVGRRRQEIKSQSQTSYKPPVAKSKLNL
ncbi:zinc ribbon domain-containing protein, partial [bacterium]|nr:zinc ribbon domain-containing protein [bacterium]